jgi:hypothetical protein
VRLGRVIIVCAATALAITGLPATTVGAAPAAPAAPVAPAGGAADEATAIERARVTRVPVEVMDRRTPTEEVFARPDGALESRVSLTPVRTRQPDGSWVGVDTSLRPVNGRLAPAAAPTDVTLSAGGSGPLATLTVAGRSLSMSWPTALRAPRIDGSAATYPDVFPGVDLRIAVNAEGFEEQLVVRTAESLTSLRTIRFGLATTGGITVRAETDGGLTAKLPGGTTVFRSPPAVMWDTPARPEAVAAGLRGAHQAPVGVRVSADALELIPDPVLLAAPDLTFPLVIDPTWSTRASAWTQVNAFSPTSTTWRTDPPMLALGYQNFQPQTRVRSFVRFPISSAIYGSQIRDATLRLYENWSPSCDPRIMEVWSTGSFSSATSWNNQPGWAVLQDSANIARGWSTSCPAANLEFTVKPAVAAATAAHGAVTLGLKAPTSLESDPLSWKKFQIDAASPQLTIVYNRPPRTPAATDLSTSNPTTSCGTSRVNGQNGVLLKVKASDPDGDKVRVYFSITHVGGSTTDFYAPAISSGGTASWQVAGPLGNGRTYTWKAHVRDVLPSGAQMSASAWSPTCTLIQDSTVPDGPSVTSTHYPPGEYGTVLGRTGSFTLTGPSDAVGFQYGLDQPSPTTYIAAAGGIPKTVSATPTTWGPHDLHVRTKDAAGNLSSVTSYRFYVAAPSDAKAYWRLDEGIGTTTTGTREDTPAASGPAATLTGGASWVGGRVDGGLRFDGATGGATTGERVDTSGGFTVSAWVKVRSKTVTATVLSQDGGTVSGFSLQYWKDTDRFAFSMPRQDGAGTVDRALSSTAVPLDTWTHLTGVHWPVEDRIELYVNGALDGTAAHPTAFDATGTVQLGRARAAAGPVERWNGDIDEVRVYDRIVAGTEVADIVNHTKPGPVAVWGMDDNTSSATAAETSGRLDPKPLTRNTGNSFGAGQEAGGLVLTGANAATAGPVVDTTGSFSVSAWVRTDPGPVTITALSEVGGTSARFALAHRSDGKWLFNLTSGDVTSPTVWGGASTTAAVANRWTLLAADWDSASKKAHLWVDGKLEATFDAPGGWNAGSNFLVGGSRAAGGPANRWIGSIDEVRVHARVLYAGEAADLYRNGHTLADPRSPGGRWLLNEASGTTAADASLRNRPMTLSGSAQFAPVAGRAALSLNPGPEGDIAGTASTASTMVRTDRSFAVSAWVRLTDDQREQAVISQDGVNTSGFRLSFSPDGGGLWRFTLPPGDGAEEAAAPAEVPAGLSPVGTWVFLLAEYDSFSRVTRLSLRSEAGSGTGYGRQDRPWNAVNQFRLGRSRATAAPEPDAEPVRTDGSFLAGAIDEVSVYSGVLSTGDRAAVLPVL